MPPKMNLNQITLPVTDVERAIAFYETLGHRLIVKALPRYARFECAEGDATFSLYQVESEAGSPTVYVYFEVQELDDVVATLKAKGIAFDEPPEDKPWLWREARVRDPDGNRLILYFAGNNRKNPPWRING